jgi:hypothetical protein
MKNITIAAVVALVAFNYLTATASENPEQTSSERPHIIRSTPPPIKTKSGHSFEAIPPTLGSPSAASDKEKAKKIKDFRGLRSESSGKMEGGVATGGGDADEISFEDVAANILAWIESGNADTLIMPSNISLRDYKSKMIEVLANYQVNFTDENILVAGKEKTCRNFVDQLRNQIECNIDRFKKIKAEGADQVYKIVHHEFAGLIRAELNSGSDSDYSISKQISAFLEFQVVKRLPVKPSGKIILLTQVLNGVELTLLSQAPLISTWEVLKSMGPENDQHTSFMKTYGIFIDRAIALYDGGNSVVYIKFSYTTTGSRGMIRLDEKFYYIRLSAPISSPLSKIGWIDEGVLRAYYWNRGFVEIRFDQDGNPKLASSSL